MATKIKQGDIFGRIGSGLGQGISEALPQEIQRGRLAAGLNELGQQKGLTPFQRFSALSSLPGVTPQMIQSGTELLRQEGLRNTYKRAAEQGQGYRPENMQASPSLQDVKFGQIPGKVERNFQQQPNQEYPLVNPNEKGQPQIEKTNPLRQEALPRGPWTPEEKMDRLAYRAEQFPDATDDQLQSMVADDERRDLAKSETERAQDQYREGIALKVKDKFDKDLGLLLQKEGAEKFQDITGELQKTALRTIERNLASNPKLSVEDAVNEGVQNLLNFAKVRKDIDGLATISSLEALNPLKRGQNYDKLKSYASSYDKMDRNEELFDKLRTKTSTDQNGNLVKIGFDFSPQQAAVASYSTDKFPNFKEDVKKVSQRRHGYSTKELAKFTDPKNSISYAINAEKYISNPKFSLLSAANEYAKADPNFNQSVFFNQLRKDRDDKRVTFTPFQERELNFGEKDFFPSWGDIFYVPFFK